MNEQQYRRIVSEICGGGDKANDADAREHIEGLELVIVKQQELISTMKAVAAVRDDCLAMLQTINAQHEQTIASQQTVILLLLKRARHAPSDTESGTQ